MGDEKQTIQEVQNPQKNSAPTFWEKLSIWQKVIIGVILLTFLFIAWTFIFGGVNSIFEFAFIILLTIVLFIILYFITIAGELIFRSSYYSPKEDYFTKLSNMAIDYCPDNLNKLWFQGSTQKRAVVGGKIIGCLGIPYLIGEPILDEKGMQEYVKSDFLDVKVPVFKKIHYGAEGDTLIIYQKGWFIFKKKHYLRCNMELHSELHGDVVVYDINPIPYGKFFEFPFKQVQRNPQRIMLQSQLEVILATHEHQGDLISQSADAGIYYNPYFKMVKETNAEISRDG